MVSIDCRRVPHICLAHIGATFEYVTVSYNAGAMRRLPNLG